MIRLRRSGPAMTRSIASLNSSAPIDFLLRRAARMAASLTRFARSAPEKPGERRASASRSTVLSSGLPLMWTLRISLRPLMSGRSSTTWRSKRPGRSSAGSRTSGRLVAATTITLVFVSKPSISTRIWFRVCSRSSCEPPRPAPRWRPTASISSTNTMHGELRLACSNRSRTREAPTPTNISTNSEPEIEKKGTPASPATARASSVLPVPGGPTSSTPRGIRAPSELNFSGYFRNSTTSVSSCFASSTPATSLKVTTVLLPRNMRARLLPKLIAWLLVPCAWRIMKKMNAPMSSTGSSAVISSVHDAAGGARLDRVELDLGGAFGWVVACPAASQIWLVVLGALRAGRGDRGLGRFLVALERRRSASVPSW